MLEKKTKYVSVYTPSELENWEDINLLRKVTLQQYYVHVKDEDKLRDIYDNAFYNTDLIVYDYDQPYVRRELVHLNLGDDMGTYSFNMHLDTHYITRNYEATYDEICAEIMEIIDNTNDRDDIRVWACDLHQSRSPYIWKFTLAISMSMKDCKDQTWKDYHQNFDKVIYQIGENNSKPKR